MDTLDADEHCELAEPMEHLHKFLHMVLPDMDEEQQIDARLLALKILDVFNAREDLSNAIKFLALYKVLKVGTDLLQEEVQKLKMAMNKPLTNGVQ